MGAPVVQHIAQWGRTQLIVLLHHQDALRTTIQIARRAIATVTLPRSLAAIGALLTTNVTRMAPFMA